MHHLPSWPERRRLARGSNTVHAANMVTVSALAAAGAVPWGVLLPFGASLLEAIYGGLVKPALAVRPIDIGIRQTVVTILFAALMITAYRI